MKFPLYLGGLAALATAGCHNPEYVGRPGLQTVMNTPLPPPTAANATIATRAAVLGPGDTISVAVFGVPELTRDEVAIDSNGSISLPLVGTLEAAGRTTAQIGEEIRSRLVGRYVRDPDVSVNAVEITSQKFAIEGEVNRPGVYPLVGETTLLRAIAEGGGTTQFARSNLIIVYRRVGEEDMAALYDVRAIRLGAYEDPRVYPGDLVVVNEDRAFRMFGTIIQGSGILLTPVITVLNRL